MKHSKINIIGLGNTLHGDEGFGVAAVNAFRESSSYPESVSFIDGGTQGVYLLDFIESCDALMVFDALIPLEYDRGVYVYRNEELPAFIHRKMSSHQMGFSELIGVAKLRGRMPKELVLIGIPPRELELSLNLSAEVSGLLPEAVEKGRAIVDSWLSAEE
ncbi:HyaD/HybD family hydrogenase maturation endopeptidase [Chlorobium ferrooxidans]|uniref:HyaD/HybD family hydrogenase maturation endopeptidase n=1 Tax=Chlorobium ferrooxidans TaxID=84205 RepID=UPI00058EAF1B|nr:HyaD/HybD family hydrogenase maturation endopeptidase [Chlorobium ferrooxidans]